MKLSLMLGLLLASTSSLQAATSISCDPIPLNLKMGGQKTVNLYLSTHQELQEGLMLQSDNDDVLDFPIQAEVKKSILFYEKTQNIFPAGAPKAVHKKIFAVHLKLSADKPIGVSYNGCFPHPVKTITVDTFCRQIEAVGSAD